MVAASDADLGEEPSQDASALPSDLLHAIAETEGGRVVLVAGAGVSVESPTNLPLSRECAEDAHRRLLADGVFADGACSDPQDLSAVADAVVAATGQQRELVQRLPREQFVGAQPNVGHLLAAALLRERAISSVLTLNFDLAFTTALAMIGAAQDVAQIRGPGDQGLLASHNLVYLHRTANHGAEEWILRTEALASEWTNNWEEAIASRVLTAPVVVFAGLGSPAAVLIDTTTRLRAILQEGVRVYQVDIVERDHLAFAAQLELGDGDYIRLGWIEFMCRLSGRVVTEQLDALVRACSAMCDANDWPQEDLQALCESFASEGLLLLGRVRARWLLAESPYLPHHACDVDHIADLTLAVRTIERVSETSARVQDDGVVEFWAGAELRSVIAFVSAQGKWRWGALEPRVERARQTWRTRQVDLRKVVVAGVTGARNTISPPETIVGLTPAGDIIRGGSTVQYFTVDDLRQDLHGISELMSV